MERILTIEIPEQFDKKDVKYVLKTRLGISSGLLAKIKARSGSICVNNEPVYVTRTLRTGDVLFVRLEDGDEKSENIVPTKGALSIIYEDDDVLILDKPPGLNVHPSMGEFYNTLANHVAYYYMKQNLCFKFRPVNRLDRNTSGLMIVAKNQFSHGALSRQQREGHLLRRYMALVEGVIEGADGTITAPIGRITDSAIERGVTPDGKYAKTDYIVEKRYKNSTLVVVSPATGRTHQIRVHFAHIGHPLVGDFLYGKERREIIPRHALHSFEVSFFHPITGEDLTFRIPPPKDITDAAEYIGKL